MALTISIIRAAHVGNRKEVVADVTFDSSYATGGESLTGADLGLGHELDVVVGSHAKNSTGTSAVPVVYDAANSKLQAYRYDGASAGKAFLEEVTSAVDLSTFTVRVKATGIGTAAG